MNLRGWIERGSKPVGAAHFTLPLELEAGRAMRSNRKTLRVGALSVLAFALWASLTPIRELAIAPGQIIPKGDIKAVQHLEGGIVVEILAAAGDPVRAGDALLKLADPQAGRELAQLSARAEALTQQRRQVATLLGSAGLELRTTIGGETAVALAQQGVLAARLKARLDENKVIEARIQQRHAEIKGIEQEIEGFRRLVDIQSERARLREDLLAKGLLTRREWLNDKAALEQARSQQTNAESRLAALREQLGEAEGQLLAAETEARRLWSEERSRVEAELSETREALAKLRDRVDRLVVRAPADGVVQFMVPKASGEVVKPGDVVARIVPVGAALVAEVEVRADDIGHVKPGDRADLRVSTFDPSVYGKLPGSVSAVSASSFQRQNGEYFFKATIRLDSETLVGSVPVTAGMVVSAEIVTGAKSFARYLLKPVFKGLAPAFAEK